MQPAQPRYLHEYVAWLRAEFDREVPARLHERGVEPSSALGSPRMGGAFRAYLTGSAFATDHDVALDTDERNAAYLRPVQRSITVLSHRWPLSARLAFAIAWGGCDWQDVTLSWRMVPEAGHLFAEGALRRLWAIWARGSTVA